MSASRARLANAAHAAMLQRGELRRSMGLTTSNLKKDALTKRGKYHVKSTAHDMADFAREEVQSKRFLIGVAAIGGLAFLFRRPLQEKAPAALQSASLRVKRFAAQINRQLDPLADDADYEGLLTPRTRKRDKVKQQLARLNPKQLKASQLWPAALAGGAKAKAYLDDSTPDIQDIRKELEDHMKPLNETARDTREKASELASRAADSARQTAEAAKARVQDGYGRARETGAELAAKGREQASHAKDAAGKALEKGKDHAKVAGGKLKEFADDQPLTLFVGALAAGLLVGSLLSGNDSDERK